MKEAFHYHWTLGFFGLQPKDRKAIHTEIFHLCYFGKGGFNQTEVYELPIYLRKFYLYTLSEQIKKENKEAKKASKRKH